MGRSEMDGWKQWAKQVKSIPQKPLQNKPQLPPPTQLTQGSWEPIVLPNYPKKIGCNSCRRFS